MGYIRVWDLNNPLLHSSVWGIARTDVLLRAAVGGAGQPSAGRVLKWRVQFVLRSETLFGAC